MYSELDVHYQASAWNHCSKREKGSLKKNFFSSLQLTISTQNVLTRPRVRPTKLCASASGGALKPATGHYPGVAGRD